MYCYHIIVSVLENSVIWIRADLVIVKLIFYIFLIVGSPHAAA